MANRREMLIDFVKVKADGEPMPKRSELYRALADMCGSPKDTAKLNELADELESADRKCREFAFQFNQQGGVK